MVDIPQITTIEFVHDTGGLIVTPTQAEANATGVQALIVWETTIKRKAGGIPRGFGVIG